MVERQLLSGKTNLGVKQAIALSSSLNQRSRGSPQFQRSELGRVCCFAVGTQATNNLSGNTESCTALQEFDFAGGELSNSLPVVVINTHVF